MIKLKKFTLGIISLALVLGTTGCGSSGLSVDSSTNQIGGSGISLSSDIDMGYRNPISDTIEQSEYNEQQIEEKVNHDFISENDYIKTPDSNVEETSDTDIVLLDDDKLVYSAKISLETLDYATTVTQLKDLVKEYGGIIQSESENDTDDEWYYTSRDYYGEKRCYISIRVPSQKFNEFVNQVGVYGKVMSKSTSVDNISQQYYDTTVKVEALEKEQKKLLEMMDIATSISDMIEVESRLSDIETELMQLKTNIRDMDTDVAYSYVDVSIKEVHQYTPEEDEGFLTRIKNTIIETANEFVKFLQNFVLAIIRLVPTIIIVGIILVVFYKFNIWDKIADIRAKRHAKKIVRRRKQLNKILNEMENKNKTQQDLVNSINADDITEEQMTKITNERNQVKNHDNHD